MTKILWSPVWGKQCNYESKVATAICILFFFLQIPPVSWNATFERNFCLLLTELHTRWGMNWNISWVTDLSQTSWNQFCQAMSVHSLHGLSLSVTKGSSQGRLATGAPNMHAHPRWFLGIELPPRKKKNLQISRLFQPLVTELVQAFATSLWPICLMHGHEMQNHWQGCLVQHWWCCSLGKTWLV